MTPSQQKMKLLAALLVKTAATAPPPVDPQGMPMEAPQSMPMVPPMDPNAMAAAPQPGMTPQGMPMDPNAMPPQGMPVDPAAMAAMAQSQGMAMDPNAVAAMMPPPAGMPMDPAMAGMVPGLPADPNAMALPDGAAGGTPVPDTPPIEGEDEGVDQAKEQIKSNEDLTKAVDDLKATVADLTDQLQRMRDDRENAFSFDSVADAEDAAKVTDTEPKADASGEGPGVFQKLANKLFKRQG